MISGKFIFSQGDISEQPHHDVVEVMRDAASQCPQALEIPHFLEFRLNALTGQGDPDMRGNSLEDLDRLGGETILVPVVELNQADDVDLVADRNQGQRGVALVDTPVAGVMAGILLGGNVQ